MRSPQHPHFMPEKHTLVLNYILNPKLYIHDKGFGSLKNAVLVDSPAAGLVVISLMTKKTYKIGREGGGGGGNGTEEERKGGEK